MKHRRTGCAVFLAAAVEESAGCGSFDGVTSTIREGRPPRGAVEGKGSPRSHTRNLLQPSKPVLPFAQKFKSEHTILAVQVSHAVRLLSQNTAAKLQALKNTLNTTHRQIENL